MTLVPPLITVRCFDNWDDFEDALMFLTPGGTGIVEGVRFVCEDGDPADWIGVFNHPDRSLRLRADPGKIFYAIGEPPGPEHRLFHIGQGEGSHVLTSDEDICRNPPLKRHYTLAPCMTRTWTVRRTIEELRSARVTEKPRKLSWITSNLTKLHGHRYRMEFLSRLRERIDFDLYGRGFAPVADKWDALAPYRYSIAFENMRSPYYFTEKLMDCFVTETMPIYCGSPAIARFFPLESMIMLEPGDPDAVEKIEEAIGSDLWSRRKDAILEAKRLVIEEYNLFARLAKFVRTRDVPGGHIQRLRIDKVEMLSGSS